MSLWVPLVSGLVGWAIGKLVWKRLERSGQLPLSFGKGVSAADRARRRLAQTTALLPSSSEGFERGLVRDGMEVGVTVDARARSLLIVRLNTDSTPPLASLELPFRVPTYAGSIVVTWVDPGAPLAELDWCLDLAHAARGTGLWGELALREELQAARLESGHPFLQGCVSDSAVSIVRGPEGLSVVASVPDGVSARPGQGDTGNPVLDLLLDTQGLPAAAHEAVLLLVHGQGGTLEQGQLRVLHPGPLGEVWPAVQVLLTALRAANSGTHSPHGVPSC